MIMDDLSMSLAVLFVTRIFFGFVFLEQAIRNRTAKESIVSAGWFVYAFSPYIGLINYQRTGDIFHPWLPAFTVMGTLCLLYGLILYYFNVAVRKAGIIFICIAPLIIGILIVFPEINPILTVAVQTVLLLSTALIVLFRRLWIIKTAGIYSYIWLSLFFVLSLAGTSLHLFFPLIAQSVKFLFTFIINLFLFMVFLHFDRERSFQKIKEDEMEISASLREKEILLQELHHRVKNNMTIMTSLLNIQSSTSENHQLKEQLEKAQSRIEAMALVHEYLYESKNMTEIHFKDYVEGLIAYWLTFLGNDISIRLNISDFKISPDKLVSCGLIINEIISNSYKHAFTASGNNRISIEARMDDNIQLTLRDNGKGLPDSLDPEQSEGIGFQLIDSLCIQLNADMEISNDNGTEYRFIIPAG